MRSPISSSAAVRRSSVSIRPYAARFSLGYDVTLLSDGHTTGDMGELTFAQIVAHHNHMLGGFHAGAHAVELRRAGEITF